MAFTDDKIRFIWCTDIHVADSDSDAQTSALEKAVNDCNEWKPNAFIATGDIGENKLSHVQRWFYHVWRCQRPVHVSIGSHDLSEYAPGSYGNPAELALAGELVLNRSSPFYYSHTLTSGDGTFTALCLFLDVQYYDDDPTPLDAPGNSAHHEPGDRWGMSDLTPGGGWYQKFSQAQLDWITATLAANESNAVLIFVHFPPPGRVTDYTALADVLQPDPRPIIGFCGHNHGWAIGRTLTTTDTLRSFTFYEMVDMSTSYAWCRVTLGFSGGNITIDEAEIQNYTDPGGYSINAPFTLAA